MMREKVVWTLRCSASSSGEGVISSGASSICATRYGSSETKPSMRTRCAPWTRIRSVPSGTLSMRATTPATPTR